MEAIVEMTQSAALVLPIHIFGTQTITIRAKLEVAAQAMLLFLWLNPENRYPMFSFNSPERKTCNRGAQAAEEIESVKAPVPKKQ